MKDILLSELNWTSDIILLISCTWPISTSNTIIIQGGVRSVLQGGNNPMNRDHQLYFLVHLYKCVTMHGY